MTTKRARMTTFPLSISIVIAVAAWSPPTAHAQQPGDSSAAPRDVAELWRSQQPLRRYQPEPASRCDDRARQRAEPEPEPETEVAPEVAPEAETNNDGIAGSPSDRDAGGEASTGGGQILAEEPAISWRAWTLRGDIPAQDQKQLETFLRAEMRRHPNLDRQHRCALQRFVERELGYHLAGIAIFPYPGGGYLAVLDIAPLTRVRHVKVEFAEQRFREFLLPWCGWRQVRDIVFATDISRRLRLRPGVTLASVPEARAAQLRQEKERIRQYLQSEGFYGAEFALELVPAGDHAVKLRISGRRGPPFRIGRVTVFGNDNSPISDGEIRQMLRPMRTDLECRLLWPFSRRPARFRQQVLNRNLEDVERRFRQRGFPAVRLRTELTPNAGVVDIAVYVTARRRVDVRFEGDRQAPIDTFQRLLTFEREGSYDDVEIAASAEAIRRHYQSRGYFEARVLYSRFDLSRLDRIVFTLYPGPQLGVASICIAGNSALPFDAVAARVPLQIDRALTDAQVAQTRERILALYKRSGYRSAKVMAQISRLPRASDVELPIRAQPCAPSTAQDDVAAPPPIVDGHLVGGGALLATQILANPPRTALHVRYQIDEGPRTVIGGIDFAFSGPHRQNVADLLALLGFAEGSPYVAAQIEQARERIGRKYYQDAFPRAQVEQCVVLPPESRDAAASSELAAQVRFEIAENQQVRFGKVIIHGNFKTDERLIRSELNFREGELLTLRRVEEGQDNLRATGLFNSVQVRFIGLDSGYDARVNVVVDVQERHDYKLGMEFAGGFSTDRGGFIETALFNHNIAGLGLRLETRLQASGFINQSQTGASSGFSLCRRCSGELTAGLPRWLVDRFTLRVFNRFEAAAFYRQEDTERFGALTNSGVGATFSRTLGRGRALSLRYELRTRRIDEDLIRGAGASDDLSRSPVPDTRTGALTLQFTADRRRDAGGRANPLTPEGGYKFDLYALGASPFLGGEDTFVKLGAAGQVFWRLGSRFLVSNGVRYDHGIPIPLRDAVLPEVERFFAGGDTTVRGFEEDRLATEVIETAIPPLGQVSRIRILPAGGNVRFIHNIDLQVRVWEFFDQPVASAIFLDTGLVTNSLRGIEVTDLRHAVGLALFRFVWPIGSLSLEYAMPIDPELGDNPRGRYHFNLGLLF